mmetsp:Transcript_47058/g.112137  ORF Transcript_47058/g.112137 Transcript_47058/m.112137 type:complete len:249 (-) Transcript_47058:139-885(-)
MTSSWSSRISSFLFSCCNPAAISTSTSIGAKPVSTAVRRTSWAPAMPLAPRCPPRRDWYRFFSSASHSSICFPMRMTIWRCVSISSSVGAFFFSLRRSFSSTRMRACIRSCNVCTSRRHSRIDDESCTLCFPPDPDICARSSSRSVIITRASLSSFPVCFFSRVNSSTSDSGPSFFSLSPSSSYMPSSFFKSFASSFRSCFRGGGPLERLIASRRSSLQPVSYLSIVASQNGQNQSSAASSSLPLRLP